MAKIKPYNVIINVYKASGKWGYEATATVDVYPFDEDFIPQILATQDGLQRDWYKNWDGYMTTDNVSDDNNDPFVKSLYRLDDIRSKI